MLFEALRYSQAKSDWNGAADVDLLEYVCGVVALVRAFQGAGPSADSFQVHWPSLGPDLPP